MYAIRRGQGGGGQFLADGPVYTGGNPPVPSPLWQHLDGDRAIYIEEFLWIVTKRKERLEKIYTAYELNVVKLTDDELEYLTFRKLLGK